MRRKLPAVLTALFLAVLLPALCAAEESATPTDLVCAHEQTVTTIYFFDSPSYTSLSPATHLVSGPAVVETVCRDCGATLSAETASSVEEVRPHSMKKGVCALCGYRQPTTVSHEKKDAPGERTLTAQPDGNGLLFLTLTEQDLAALESAKVRTLLVRGESGNAVVAMNVKKLREEISRGASSVSVEMQEKEDGSLFAGLSLSSAPGRTQEADPEGVSLRFYGEQEADLRVGVNPADGDAPEEADASWQEDGYWTVPYVREGTYLPLE